MKAKTIEKLRNKFFMDCTNMNDGNPKVDITPHDLFEWIKENIIQPEPQEFCSCKNRQDQFERGEKCICGDCENEIIQHSLPIVSEPKQVTEGIEGSVLINRLNDSSFEDLLKYLNVNYEIVKKEPFCDTEFKISIQDLDSAIWIGRRFQMQLQGEGLESLQNKEDVTDEVTIFPEKEYHFQFRDLETLRGISDYKVSGKRLMQYLHNAELSVQNNEKNMKATTKEDLRNKLMSIQLSSNSFNLEIGLSVLEVNNIQVDYVYSDYTVVTEFEEYSDDLFETMKLILEHIYGSLEHY